MLVWLEEDGAVRPEEKRETAHGRIYSIRVMPTSTSKNPLADIEGFPEDMISEVVVFEPTGIHEPKDDGRTVEKRNEPSMTCKIAGSLFPRRACTSTTERKLSSSEREAPQGASLL